MCGLVGVLSTELNTFQHSYGKFFKQALFADTLRGADSTGIFVMDTKKMVQPDLYKKALAAPDFLQLKKVEDLLKDSHDWNVMIGHNRAATKGGIHHHTAHPFQIGDITLVHNGTVHNHRMLPNGHKFDVDSEAICDAINDIGIEEVVKKIDGAFTFIWHDRRNGSMNFIRNEERPLAFGKVKDKNTILMASEAGMLRWLAIRNGLSLESIAEPKPGELFVFWPYKDNKDWTSKYDRKTLELRPKNVYQGYSGGVNYGNGYSSNHTNHGGGKGGKKSSTGNHTSSGGQSNSKKSTQVRTTSKHGHPDAILSSLQVVKGEEVCLINTRWIAYPGSKNNFGEVRGEIEDITESHIGIIHGVNQETWETELKGNYIYSEIQGATIDITKEVNVFLNNRDYCIVDPTEVPGNSCVKTTVDYTDEDNDESAEEENKALAVVMFRGFNGEQLSLREFERAVQDGCAYCQGNIDPKDHEKTGWTHQRQPVCKHCVKDHDLGEYLH